ncbi:MAG TPA: cell division protein ZapA [Leadbetterella sp.]|jgi:cell division protein ZapA (FtsZ GTPase activity inhibitor)|nr:cell division protein ZapA [Leadbetterella sp.]
MESEEATVILELNGERINLKVPKSEEVVYQDAKKMLISRLAELRTEHAAFTNADVLISVLALEAAVDALMINERYQRLKIEVNSRLESIQANFEN